MDYGILVDDGYILARSGFLQKLGQHLGHFLGLQPGELDEPFERYVQA